jgi:hypothetical protein
VSTRTWAILAGVVFVLGIGALILFTNPRTNEVTVKVVQQFSAGPTLVAEPQASVEIIDGAGVYETGELLRIEYKWDACDDCDGNIWADHGEAMGKANVAAANTFRQDYCYRVTVSSSGSNDYGVPIVLYSSESGKLVKIPCP